jgi:hypothetical protein
MDIHIDLKNPRLCEGCPLEADRCPWPYDRTLTWGEEKVIILHRPAECREKYGD